MTLEKIVDGVRVPLTAEEIAQRDADAAAHAVTALAQATEKLWQLAWRWGDQNFAHVDRGVVQAWISQGRMAPAAGPMWDAMINWQDDLFDNYYSPAKDAIIAAGKWVEPDWSTWPVAPHSFNDFKAQRTS